MSKEKLVLHFPGGAFVLAYGHERTGLDVSRVMTSHLRIPRTFLAQYRVSTDSSARFPAAIQDLVTFYHYILSLGFRPENIILSGDSADGNLLLGLLRYLEDTKHPDLPLPGGAMLWSPWVQVTSDVGLSYGSWKNLKHDFIIPELLKRGLDAHLPTSDLTNTTLPYISPLGHAFKTSVPSFVHAGGCEAPFDQIKEFAMEMAGVEKNRVRFCVTDVAPHVLLLAHRGLGSEVREGDGRGCGGCEDVLCLGKMNVRKGWLCLLLLNRSG